MRITLPQLGESVAEGTIARWFKQPGDRIERDETLVEIHTDKVNAEYPSPAAGVVREILAPEGATLPVGAEIAVIEVEGAAGTDSAERASAPATAAESAEKPATRPVPAARATDSAGNGRARMSPFVRRVAAEHGIDVAQLSGTGLGGRVTKDDVLRYLKEAPAAPEQSRPAAAPAAEQPKPAPGPVPWPGDEVQPAGPMRRAIAEHMVRSVHTSPHAWTQVEADLTGLVRLRQDIRARFREETGVDLTYLPFFVQAVVEGLRAYRPLNSTWSDGQIIVRRRINIGIAVAVDDGLIVPVIHDADEKNIVGLARAVADLTERARAGTLRPEDVRDGTFTLNNPGAFGAINSVSIINQPQAAILAVNAIVKRPVVVDDMIAIRSMMNLSLSFDHRILDGAIALNFLNFVKGRLESLGPDTSVL